MYNASHYKHLCVQKGGNKYVEKNSKIIKIISKSTQGCQRAVGPTIELACFVFFFARFNIFRSSPLSESLDQATIELSVLYN